MRAKSARNWRWRRPYAVEGGRPLRLALLQPLIKLPALANFAAKAYSAQPKQISCSAYGTAGLWQLSAKFPIPRQIRLSALIEKQPAKPRNGLTNSAPLMWFQ